MFNISFIKLITVCQCCSFSLLSRESCADVYFVDYGSTETFSVEDVCASFPDSFKVLPPQAARCALAGLNPVCSQSLL